MDRTRGQVDFMKRVKSKHACAATAHESRRAKINIDIYRNPAHAVLARLKVPNQASCRQFKRSRWFGREINGDQRDRNVKLASN